VAAPETSKYVTLATDSTLTEERVLTPGDHVTGTDGGAGSTYTIDVDPIWMMTCMLAALTLTGAGAPPRLCAGFVAWFFENVAKTGLDPDPAVEASVQLAAFLSDTGAESVAARDTAGVDRVTDNAITAVDDYVTDAGVTPT